jgi:hypothetical protein
MRTQYSEKTSLCNGDDQQSLMLEVWSRAADVLYECEALASLRHTYLGSFFLEPEDIISQRLGGQSGTQVKE